ncbi:hypothetical protein CHU00_03635 [Sphingobacterium cellulitidis]|nr:hypothetical protein CHT99_02755 [Sphingobacterium cellulitidis]OYD47163.1 hypothetical protein CHU00_03635 [Sphingobacterium cellulitidis]
MTYFKDIGKSGIRKYLFTGISVQNNVTKTISLLTQSIVRIWSARFVYLRIFLNLKYELYF